MKERVAQMQLGEAAGEQLPLRHGELFPERGERCTEGRLVPSPQKLSSPFGANTGGQGMPPHVLLGGLEGAWTSRCGQWREAGGWSQGPMGTLPRGDGCASSLQGQRLQQGQEAASFPPEPVLFAATPLSIRRQP